MWKSCKIYTIFFLQIINIKFKKKIDFQIIKKFLFFSIENWNTYKR
jgi:hypothetical protein